MATIKGKTKAWLSQYSFLTPQDIESGKAKAEQFIFSSTDLSDQGYTLAGVAEITVDTVNSKELIDNKVHSLREEAKSIRAEAHKRCVEIEDKVQKLLAISYDAPEEA